MIADQLAEVGRVLAVHALPSGDVAAVVPPLAMAQNTVPLYLIADQLAEEGKVRAVHVIPSGDVAALLLPLATAQKPTP